MTTKAPEVQPNSNLSHAWARAFTSIHENPKSSLAPLVVAVSEFQNGVPIEDPRVRALLDAALRKAEKRSCRESAAMIFPEAWWCRFRTGSRRDFYDTYLKRLLPRLKARDRNHPKGTYFERMIAAEGVLRRDGRPEIVQRNQLEHIIDLWQEYAAMGKRPRQSALEVSCFDPAKDHTHQPRRGFPCLQQIGLAYDNEGGLAINAFYPTQYLFSRAYGNYLGLCHLGAFMAQALDLEFKQLNCFIGRPELGVTKKAVNELVGELRIILASGT